MKFRWRYYVPGNITAILYYVYITFTLGLLFNYAKNKAHPVSEPVNLVSFLHISSTYAVNELCRFND